jgi:hypothetical protein
MLFIFDQPQESKFWMKDMQFPLDILWLNEDREIIYIKESLQPETYPNTFGPDTPAQYVIEINAGLVEIFDIRVRDTCDWSF